jgi:hypothetical protein
MLCHAFLPNPHDSGALLIAACTIAPAVAQDSPEALAFFETRIRPLLVDRCYSCHGAETAEAGFAAGYAEWLGAWRAARAGDCTGRSFRQFADADGSGKN